MSDIGGNIDIEISAVLGKTKIRIGRLVKIRRGEIIELDTRSHDLLTLYSGGIPIAKGEVITTADGNISIRITEILQKKH